MHKRIDQDLGLNQNMELEQGTFLAVGAINVGMKILDGGEKNMVSNALKATK